MSQDGYHGDNAATTTSRKDAIRIGSVVSRFTASTAEISTYLFNLYDTTFQLPTNCMQSMPELSHSDKKIHILTNK